MAKKTAYERKQRKQARKERAEFRGAQAKQEKIIIKDSGGKWDEVSEAVLEGWQKVYEQNKRAEKSTPAAKKKARAGARKGEAARDKMDQASEDRAAGLAGGMTGIYGTILKIMEALGFLEPFTEGLSVIIEMIQAELGDELTMLFESVMTFIRSPVFKGLLDIFSQIIGFFMRIMAGLYNLGSAIDWGVIVDGLKWLVQVLKNIGELISGGFAAAGEWVTTVTGNIGSGIAGWLGIN